MPMVKRLRVGLVLRQSMPALKGAIMFAVAIALTVGAQVNSAKAQSTATGQSTLTFSPRPLPATVLAGLPRWGLTSEDWLKMDSYDLKRRVLEMHSERELWSAAVRMADPIARVVVAEESWTDLSDPEAILRSLEEEPWISSRISDNAVAGSAADAAAAVTDAAADAADAVAAAAADAANAAAAAAGYRGQTPRQLEARDRWLRPLAESGDPRAQALLGAMLEESDSLPVRRAGRALYTQAALGGLRPAMHHLALMDYLESLGTSPPLSDPQNRGRWNERLAELGDAGGMVALADELDTGRFGRQDPVAATRWLMRAAEAGEARAFRKLGIRGLLGIGMRQDPAVAAGWFRRGVEAGDDVSMVQLSLMYRRGNGVRINLRESVRLARQAADLYNTTGMVLLGYALLTGEGVDANPEAAIGWFRKAAEFGDCGGMLALAYQLERGTDLIRPRLSEALYWYKEAIRTGELSEEQAGDASDRAMALEARGIRPAAPVAVSDD